MLSHNVSMYTNYKCWGRLSHNLSVYTNYKFRCPPLVGLNSQMYSHFIRYYEDIKPQTIVPYRRINNGFEI